MIEKPLADRLEGTDALATEARDQHRKVQIAYNLRFHPGLLKLRDLIQTGELGRVFWVRAEAGQYLPDWRPSQDYRQSYTARRDLGGGILLDGSHEIDYLMWLLGKPVDVFCRSGKVSALDRRRIAHQLAVQRADARLHRLDGVARHGAGTIRQNINRQSSHRHGWSWVSG